MTPIQFAAQVDGVAKKKDGTLTVKLGTQELGPQDTAQIFEMGNRLIWVAMAETAIKEDDLNIPEAITEFKSDLTPSQRLRNTLFVYWKKNKRDRIDFDSYYKREIEKIIDYLKEKLD